MGGGVDGFTSEEAFIAIGELYVEIRRQQTREEIMAENIRAQQLRVSELEAELQEYRQPEPIMTGEIS